MEILGTSSVSGAVESLVERAQKGLFIVTPYFKPWDRISRSIKGAKTRNVEVLLLLRGGDDRAKGEERARAFRTHGVKVAYLSRLHAKIYLSETEVIVTSMNLYDDSALNSFEVAIRLTKEADADAYRQVAQQVVDLAKRADEETKVTARELAVAASPMAAVHAGVAGQAPPPARPAAAKLAAAKPAPIRAAPAPSRSVAPASAPRVAACCIRCSEPLSFNLNKPLCAKCHESWAKFGKPDYQEAFCHRCGAVGKTSVAKPLCRSCWTTAA